VADQTDPQPGWQLRPPVAAAAAVNATAKKRGIYPVGSRLVDATAPGGFGPCSNFPRELDERDWGSKGCIALQVFPDEVVAYFQNQGIALRVINRTAKVASFRACDSCLFLVREALDAEGRWQTIEILPEAMCGNSFHQVYLEPNQYWEFPARQYTGSLPTKIRFRLDPGDGQPAIYSNEYQGQINPAQLVDPQDGP
jgi:hypothetical protein